MLCFLFFSPNTLLYIRRLIVFLTLSTPNIASKKRKENPTKRKLAIYLAILPIMMRQRIVINMQLNSEKHRTKAMRIAAKTQGVNSVAKIGGDQVEIMGYGIDAVKLTDSIRRKVCKHAKLESLQEGNNPYIHNYPNPPPPFYTTFYQPVYEPCTHPCTIL
ncbi:unnamed protein product [Camellia sinensis]